jgi:superfamily I DNA/RNA helicase
MSSVLLLTFSNQARSQLEREAGHQLTSDLRRKIHITNYHRFFWQGVSAYARALGLPMRIDVGSRRRRRDALSAAHGEVINDLERYEGLVDSLAEHGFVEFQDNRTPAADVLNRLLNVVEIEQRAGRLVFDDLGALFWSLITRFPSVDGAYRSRYSAVIADEHQDASALQDALVRRLGRNRHIVLADEMQLIHGFRGADAARLVRHIDECAEHRTLRTPHRWRGNKRLADWLLSMRERLQGRPTPCELPRDVNIQNTRGDHGFNAMKPAVREGVSVAFRNGASTVAVIARNNDQVAALRTYLCSQGQNPRQIGTQDFEDARDEIEQLPLLRDSQTIALYALERVVALVPTLPAALIAQIRGRLRPDRVDVTRATPAAMSILESLQPIYEDGARAYFPSVVNAIQACARAGHHLPRIDAVRALRTASELTGDDVEFEAALARYSGAVLAATHDAPKLERGLFVMTAHQCKGKEFDVVILGDATARFWPDNDDNRRLFYVVLTRATQSLVIVAPQPGASPLLSHVNPQ